MSNSIVAKDRVGSSARDTQAAVVAVPSHSQHRTQVGLCLSLSAAFFSTLSFTGFPGTSFTLTELQAKGLSEGYYGGPGLNSVLKRVAGRIWMVCSPRLGAEGL